MNKNKTNGMKTLINKPSLKIQSSDDGVWLHFKTSAGIYTSINLPSMAEDGSIIGKGLREWCVEFALTTKETHAKKQK